MQKKRIIVGGVTAVAATALLVLGGVAPANAGIKLYQFANYNTFMTDVGNGTSYVGSSYDDKTSSFTVGSSPYAILYQFRDYSGHYTGTFYSGWYDLSDFGYWTSDGNNFDNRTSSVG